MVWCCEKCQYVGLSVRWSGTVVVVWCFEKCHCQYVGLGLWWCGAVRSVSTLVWDCGGVVL